MASRLSDVPGPTVELGAGLARFREVVPDVVETDVEETPWADLVVDAESLPYAGRRAREHRDARRLPPSRRSRRAFLDEATRALAPGGRVVMVEPYVLAACRGSAYRVAPRAARARRRRVRRDRCRPTRSTRTSRRRRWRSSGSATSYARRWPGTSGRRGGGSSRSRSTRSRGVHEAAASARGARTGRSAARARGVAAARPARRVPLPHRPRARRLARRSRSSRRRA